MFSEVPLLENVLAVEVEDFDLGEVLSANFVLVSTSHMAVASL